MIKLINAMDTMLAVQSKINLGDESGSSGVGIINEQQKKLFLDMKEIFRELIAKTVKIQEKKKPKKNC